MADNRPSSQVQSHRPDGLFGRPSVRRRWVRPAVWASAILTVVAVLVGVALTVTASPSSGCTGSPTTITVVASTSQFSVVDALARRWSADKPSVGGRCAAVTVASKESSAAAAALGPNWDEVRDGLRPDVWLPESSLWLLVAASHPNAQGLLPERAPSTATSPIVLALRRPVAEALGWPQRPLAYEEIVGAFLQPGTWAKVGHPEWAALRIGMTDPTVSTAGLATALAVLDQDADNQLSDIEVTTSIAFTQTLGAMAPDTSTFFKEQGSEPQAGAPIIAAFPAIERDVAVYDAANPAIQLLPVYPKQSPIVADYPYAVLTASWVDANRRAVADKFLQYVLGPTGQQALGADGFRDPGRTNAHAPQLSGDRGFQAAVATPRKDPSVATLNQLIGQWTALQRTANILVVLDTSGSMNKPVPGTQLTRLQLLQQTAIAGFGLLTNQTKAGLWQFSTKLTPTTDYRELVPFGPIAVPVNGVPRLQALMGGVQSVKAEGGTALYDTVYAAWKLMQSQWQPNSTNAVLLITDGKNEADVGLTLDQLSARLAKESLPDKPTAIIGVAVGPEADAEALQKISGLTGGRTFVVRDAATAVQTLVLAFAGRLR
jgi:Ca-activated chloride channel homolog